MNFLIDKGCTYNLLSNDVKEVLEPWVTTLATIAEGSKLLIYGKIKLTRRLGNFSFAVELLVSRVSAEGVLGTAFLTSQKCKICFDSDVLAWRGDTIPLVDEDGWPLVHTLQPTT